MFSYGVAAALNMGVVVAQCTSAAVCCPWYMCLREKGRATVRGITTNVYYSAAHIVLSLYIIFYDDVLRAFLPKEADPAFSVVSLFAMAAFLFDLQLQSAVDRKFVYSFFWWLDIVRIVPCSWLSPRVTRGCCRWRRCLSWWTCQSSLRSWKARISCC